MSNTTTPITMTSTPTPVNHTRVPVMPNITAGVTWVAVNKEVLYNINDEYPEDTYQFMKELLKSYSNWEVSSDYSKETIEFIQELSGVFSTMRKTAKANINHHITTYGDKEDKNAMVGINRGIIRLIDEVTSKMELRKNTRITWCTEVKHALYHADDAWTPESAYRFMKYVNMSYNDWNVGCDDSKETGEFIQHLCGVVGSLRKTAKNNIALRDNAREYHATIGFNRGIIRLVDEFISNTSVTITWSIEVKNVLANMKEWTPETTYRFLKYLRQSYINWELHCDDSEETADFIQYLHGLFITLRKVAEQTIEHYLAVREDKKQNNNPMGFNRGIIRLLEELTDGMEVSV